MSQAGEVAFQPGTPRVISFPLNAAQATYLGPALRSSMSSCIATLCPQWLTCAILSSFRIDMTGSGCSYRTAAGCTWAGPMASVFVKVCMLEPVGLDADQPTGETSTPDRGEGALQSDTAISSVPAACNKPAHT